MHYHLLTIFVGDCYKFISDISMMSDDIIEISEDSDRKSFVGDLIHLQLSGEVTVIIM